MSEKKEKPVAEKKLVDMNEEVEYEAPLLPGRTQKDVICIVNGTMLRVKRGVKVKIKRKYKEAFDNANAQAMSIYNIIDETKKKGEKPLADM